MMDAEGHAESRAAPRVLMLVTSDAYAGLERHVVQLTRELRKLQVAVAIACPPRAERMRDEARRVGIPVMPARGTSKAWLVPVVRQLVRQPPDVVHAHDGRSALVAAALAPMTGATFIRTQHFHRPASVVRQGWRGGVSLSIQRQVNRRVRGYIAVSPSVAAAAEQREEIQDARLRVIPPGVELAELNEVEAARVARQALTAPTFAYIGRLEDEKQLDVLIRAIPWVIARRPDARFIVAGSGSAEAHLKSLALGEGVQDAIVWTGWVPNSSEILKKVHAYVNTWPHEGFGMAMAEAMSYGIPVIAADAAASADLVVDDQTGLLYPPGDSEALAEAVIALAENPLRRDRLGGAAMTAARASYGVERTAEATLDFYGELLAAHGRRV
jgi:glycosyltransferase involved in cell wall biosynthesis